MHHAPKSLPLIIAILLAGFISVTAVLAPAYAQGLSIIRDAEIEEWIADYSYPIFEAAQLDPDSIEFLIVANATPNAFAGGRTMGIFTGLITSADTPNQIEGVIAHEAAHMAGGHGPRRAEAFARAGRPVILSLVLAAAAIAAGAPEAGIGLLGLGQQIGTVNALAYTRGQESSADQAAVSYLDKIGHSSQGLVEFFGKLRNNQLFSARRVNPYLQSHPLANQRITALRKRVQASPYYENKDDEAAITRLQLIQAKIRGYLQQPKFTLREYPPSDRSAPGRYARAMAFYRGTDIDRALVEINDLLEDYPDYPYFQELKGQMLFEFGRVQEAVEPHRLSVKYAPTKALLRINLGRALLATDDHEQIEEAVMVLKSALRLEPDNSFGWHELARAHGALDDEGPALLCTAESRYFAGAKLDAMQFARRALPYFKRGTREWQQAQDIIIAVSNEGKRRGGPRALPPTPPPAPSPAPQTPAPDDTPDVPLPEGGLGDGTVPEPDSLP